jgi:hypothetical protein
MAMTSSKGEKIIEWYNGERQRLAVGNSPSDTGLLGIAVGSSNSDPGLLGIASDGASSGCDPGLHGSASDLRGEIQALKNVENAAEDRPRDSAERNGTMASGQVTPPEKMGCRVNQIH